MQTECYVRSFDNTRLYVASCGEGPPIILCDGLGCDGFIWRHLRKTLMHKHRVIHWNYRGHGLSGQPKHAETMGIEALVGDLAALMDSLQVPKATLLGHSMGAQVILEFALRHPHRVHRLVTLCGSFGRPLDSLHNTDLAGRLFPVLYHVALRYPALGQRIWQTFIRSKLVYAFATRFEVNGRFVENSDFLPYFEHLGAMDLSVFVRLVAYAQAHSTSERLSGVEIPTLIIAGERDTFTPPEISEKMARAMPQAELLTIMGGSHITPLEKPELVNRRIEQFLQAL